MIEIEDICLNCKKVERSGYKYCEPCKELMRVKKAKEARIRRLAGTKKMCIECGVRETNTTYCKSCAQVVKKERHNKRRRVPRKQGQRGPGVYTGKIDEKWLVRGTISANSRGCIYD